MEYILIFLIMAAILCYIWGFAHLLKKKRNKAPPIICCAQPKVYPSVRDWKRESSGGNLGRAKLIGSSGTGVAMTKRIIPRTYSPPTTPSVTVVQQDNGINPLLAGFIGYELGRASEERQSAANDDSYTGGGGASGGAGANGAWDDSSSSSSSNDSSSSYDSSSSSSDSSSSSSGC